MLIRFNKLLCLRTGGTGVQLIKSIIVFVIALLYAIVISL